MFSDNGNSSDYIVKLRAHHLFAFHAFNGKGYSTRFQGRMKWLKELFYNKPETTVQIVAQVDSICDACPHLIEDGCTKNNDPQTEMKMQKLDRAVLEVLGIQEGTQMIIEDAFYLIEDEATPDILHAVSKVSELFEFAALSSAIRKGFW